MFSVYFRHILDFWSICQAYAAKHTSLLHNTYQDVPFLTRIEEKRRTGLEICQHKKDSGFCTVMTLSRKILQQDWYEKIRKLLCSFHLIIQKPIIPGGCPGGTSGLISCKQVNCKLLNDNFNSFPVSLQSADRWQRKHLSKFHYKSFV